MNGTEKMKELKSPIWIVGSFVIAVGIFTLFPSKDSCYEIRSEGLEMLTKIENHSLIEKIFELKGEARKDSFAIIRSKSNTFFRHMPFEVEGDSIRLAWFELMGALNIGSIEVNDSIITIAQDIQMHKRCDVFYVYNASGSPISSDLKEIRACEQSLKNYSLLVSPHFSISVQSRE